MAGPNSTSSSSETLRLVRVCTREGSQYLFPDMDVTALRRVLPESGRIPASCPSLTLVNASAALLTLPFRIVLRVELADDGEALWDCPA